MIEDIQQDAQQGDKLAMFREQVEAENKTRGKMSESAVAKLRSQTESARMDAIGLTRFCNALKSVVVTPENLQTLIARCVYAGSPEKNLERREHKLQWWIRAGFLLGREIDSPSMILFFSNLTSDEASMRNERFYATWDMKSAEKIKQRRTDAGLISDVKPERLCKSGPKCLKYFKRKAGPVKGNGEYCSTACAASDRARAKRVLLAGPAASEMTQ